MSCQKMLKYVVVLCISIFSFNVFAADQVAKEDTSPPAEDGPLTAQQVPPINN